MLDSDTNAVSDLNRIRNETGMHPGSGSAKAKSFGSCGSGSSSDSRTLISWKGNIGNLLLLQYWQERSAEGLTSLNWKSSSCHKKEQVNTGYFSDHPGSALNLPLIAYPRPFSRKFRSWPELRGSECQLYKKMWKCVFKQLWTVFIGIKSVFSWDERSDWPTFKKSTILTILLEPDPQTWRKKHTLDM